VEEQSENQEGLFPVSPVRGSVYLFPQGMSGGACAAGAKGTVDPCWKRWPSTCLEWQYTTVVRQGGGIE
jgi:hypothetical protein